jgi:hypothetical protein
MSQLLNIMGTVSGQDTSNNVIQLGKYEDLGSVPLRTWFEQSEFPKMISACSDALAPRMAQANARQATEPPAAGGAAAAAAAVQSPVSPHTTTPVDTTNSKNQTIENLMASKGAPAVSVNSHGAHATNHGSSNSKSAVSNAALETYARFTQSLASKKSGGHLPGHALAMSLNANQKMESVNASGIAKRPAPAASAAPESARSIGDMWVQNKRQREQRESATSVPFHSSVPILSGDHATTAQIIRSLAR